MGFHNKTDFKMPIQLNLESVRANLVTSNASDSQIEIVVKEWLKNAKKRMAPAKKRLVWT